MSSFVRSQGATRTRRMSTGIEDLDRIIGGGMERGTSILLLEDENSQVHSTVLKVFLSEGVENKEDVVAVMKERGGVDIYETGISAEGEGGDKMVIAWRYSNLSLRRPSFRFNLSRRRAFVGRVASDEEATLEGILEIVEKERELRIVVFSLLSPIWNMCGYEDPEVARFLSQLKKFVRTNNHLCMVSVPGFFRNSMNFELYFDTVIALDSNMFTNFCPNYNGIVEFRKIWGHRGLRVNDLSSLKYGVKIRRGNIRVEKIDIPPEDDRGQTQQCGADGGF